MHAGSVVPRGQVQARRMAGLDTSSDTAASHTDKRGFPCHDSAPNTCTLFAAAGQLQRGRPTSTSPSTSTRPSDSPSPSSHSIVTHLTRPLPWIACSAAVFHVHSCLSCSCIVFFPPHSARLNTRHKTCRLSHTHATDLFNYNRGAVERHPYMI